MPFDPHTRDGGTGWSLAWRGTGADAEVVARYVRDTNLPLREPHWTTCPNFKRDGEGRTAPKHSAGGGVKPEAEPKQRDFRLDTPRDPVLAKLYGVPA